MKRWKKKMAAAAALAYMTGCLGAGEMTAMAESDVRNITWMYAQMSGMIPEDLQKVEDALNAITEEKIQVHVKLNPVSFSDYQNQISLIMASQEKMDIITTAGSNIWSTLLNQRQLTPLNDLLDEYGSGITEAVPADYLKGTTVNGNLYAITTNSTKSDNWNIVLRKDLIDQYGLQDEVEKIQAAASMADMDENIEILEGIFQVIQEQEPEMGILYPWGDHMAINYDQISDKLGVMFYDGDSIENLYASEEYQKLCETMYAWAQAGYIMKDAATTTESASSLMKSGRLFAYTLSSGRGNYVDEAATNGYEAYYVNLRQPSISNGSITLFANCIPTTSTEPEAAMEFLNLLYSDPDVVNLMAYGIEGEHYVETEDGWIAYPEGTDASNSKYPGDQSYMYGNTFLLKNHETYTTQTAEEGMAYDAQATISNCMGFNYDPSTIKNEVAACSAVLAEFRTGLEMGAIDPATELPAFLEKLEKSGINEIIAEKQRQLDEWNATLEE
ncbi:MAG: ABC transporter substrate-binding protein [Eubacteriales bacterium]|nr:ABC transporter substrate-binding protein [Eubacteriales bacterium]